MQNLLQIEQMKLLIGQSVKLVDVNGVEWIGYEEDSVAYVVGVDEDGFFEVSYSLSDKYGWKADRFEIKLI